jgi:hypothetical protein
MHAKHAHTQHVYVSTNMQSGGTNYFMQIILQIQVKNEHFW